MPPLVRDKFGAKKNRTLIFALVNLVWIRLLRFLQGSQIRSFVRYIFFIFHCKFSSSSQGIPIILLKKLFNLERMQDKGNKENGTLPREKV